MMLCAQSVGRCIVMIVMAFGYVVTVVMLGLILNVQVCQKTTFQRVTFVRTVCKEVTLVFVYICDNVLDSVCEDVIEFLYSCTNNTVS